MEVYFTEICVHRTCVQVDKCIALLVILQVESHIRAVAVAKWYFQAPSLGNCPGKKVGDSEEHRPALGICRSQGCEINVSHETGVLTHCVPDSV